MSISTRSGSMFLTNSNFRRSISVLHPNNSNSGLDKTKPRSFRSGVFRWSVRKPCRSAAGARADHEAVVSIFGNLPPQILVGTIGLHRVDGFFEVGVLGGNFSPQLVGRLQTGFQYFVGEGTKLGAVGDQTFQCGRILHVVARRHPSIGILRSTGQICMVLL